MSPPIPTGAFIPDRKQEPVLRRLFIYKNPRTGKIVASDNIGTHLRRGELQVLRGLERRGYLKISEAGISANYYSIRIAGDDKGRALLEGLRFLIAFDAERGVS